MHKELIYQVQDLVTCWHDHELAALSIKWHTEYSTTNEVPTAVEFAIDYVNKNNLKNWLCDLSTSVKALKPEDQQWVNTRFKILITESTLDKLVLMPPLPETGQDTAWLDDWEANTRAEYRGKIDARLMRDLAGIKQFFAGE